MPHELDRGKTRFRDLIKRQRDLQPRLPLVHSTDTYQFNDVLESGSIEPQEDLKVFTSEALTYFFYGRPVFHPNDDAEPSGLRHYFPVCILLKPERSPTPKRVFPFDSGAFQKKMYSQFVHEKMVLGDFALEPDVSSPSRVISFFFGDVPSYLVGRSISPRLEPSQFEAVSYSALISQKGANSSDARISGIELQTEERVSLANDVAAVVLPSSFADSETGKKLKALGIELIPYRVSQRMKPSDFNSELETLCLNFYIRCGIVKEQELKDADT